MAGEALLDAFVNANILVILGYVFWLAVRGAMRIAGFRHAYGAQLRLLNAVFLAVLAAPLIVLAFHAVQTSGIAGNVNLNLSDFVVAYYLNGGFEMNSSDFEGLILMRDTLTLQVLSGAGLLAKGVIAVFLLGFVLGVLRLAYSVLCLSRIVSTSYHWRSAGRVRIRISDKTLVPFSTRDLRYYYIVLPSRMLCAPKELDVSLAHEFEHIRAGDLEWEIVLEALKPLFFLNPGYHAWKKSVEALRELRCDSQVLGNGRIKVRDYCDTLLSVCQSSLRRDRSFVYAVPKVTLVTADRSALIGRRRSFLEHRVLSVLSVRQPGCERLLFAALAVPLLAAFVLTAIAIQRPGDWSHDRLMLSTVVNLDRLDEINRLSTFGRIRN